MKRRRLKYAGVLVLAAAFALFWVWRYHVEHQYDDLIRTAAQRYGISPGLVKAVVWRESRFNASARGSAGEIGLMQVGADAAHEWASSERISPFSHEHCTDPRTNTLVGAWYLSKALSKYTAADDPLPYALAEYNAGRRNVLRWRSAEGQTNGEVFAQQIGFPSTSNYVREIISQTDRFQRQFD